MSAIEPRYRFHRFIIISILSLSVISCSYRFVPAYDEVVIEGLSKANEETLTLFATLSNGGSPSTFKDREKSYNSTIGKFEATRILLQARLPPNSFLGRTPKESPTIPVLGTITEELGAMKKADAAGQLTAFKVLGYKQAYEISIEQALTYEKALQ